MSPFLVRTAARPRAAVCAAALAGLLAAAGCGDGQPVPRGGEVAPVGAPAAEPADAAGRAAADAVHHERFQRLASRALQLMIAAAQRALPIGPLQERIDAARLLAVSDVVAAADRLEEVIADLEALLEASG